ncbi:transcription-repair coupling factor [Thiothrix unzii]|jgi:transcription-repair coupling factor (superfamily II helicase)|uniref:transcription-repair coupling factor n=1 Tax=Thiothrix unzii TaxID=111769 RepID=UPI002A37153F|nr:transcription-repair coupling factor [Thiothrix unzii]MDX9989399.1 transcription-repair coupling factor [Thiothrix unzii]
MSVLLKPQFPAAPNGHVRWGQLYGASLDWLIAQSAQGFDGLLLLVVPDVHTAYQMESALQFFAPEIPRHIFPDWETLPYDVFSPHEDIISERLKTLATLQNLKRGILLVPATTLLHRLAPTSYVHGHTFVVRKGSPLNIDKLRKQLEEAGYRNVSQVMAHGEYATRGSLVDLFPMGSHTPYRIDLFDEEIDSIRTFNPETQRTDVVVDSIELLPAREFPLDEAGIRTFRQNYRAQVEGDLTRSRIYEGVSQGKPPAGIEYYLPLFFEHTATLFDYLPKKTLLVLAEGVDAAVKTFWETVEYRYEQRRHDIERPLLAPEKLFLTAAMLQSWIGDYPRVEVQRFKHETEGLNYPIAALPSLLIHARQEQPLFLLFNFLKDLKGRVLFTAESAGRREAFLTLLKDNGIAVKTLETWQDFLGSKAEMAVTVAPLENGFWLPDAKIAVIPENLLHGVQIQQQRRRRKATRDADAIIRNLTDLNEGAPVVHEEHGVGRYLGLETVTAGGVTAEYLLIEYANHDKLYVPVAALHLVSRYTGADPEHAPLHRLGNEQWDKARQKAAEKARDVAAELLDIHARRAAQQGYSFPFDDNDYRLFAGAFPFEETPDQALAIENVIKDMRSAQPMDRVVCGDVGFGKTEVAMRAAFVAANAGKQVAMIAPTTLLAQQHLNNFRDRFADWPFNIESLSRFKTGKETSKALEALASGKIDIVIGTHKLLQDDVHFKQLGLVIIDEEHRFGVRDKEQMKKLRANVDMLTMTATPIPRTLNMSLSGLRDLSIIATPPTQRHAIKTFVCEWNKTIIQEACARELSRGGQVYVLHNEVKTIDKVEQELSAMLPGVTVRHAHGQMRAHELENIMSDFYHQRFQILIATTIIESGIDVPTANTILINRADKLGLAQLHQLRGRVGRSHHRAYAYLIAPPKSALTPDAVKRLEAIESLEELGVGFTLATHDLEIRGAGELLGEGQSGQIQEIGFNLYNDLLERAVKALKSGDVGAIHESPLRWHNNRTTVELGAPALIPDDYLPDVHARLILYKRIASAESQAALDELRVEMIDRFGLLPEPTKTLFSVTRVKLLAQELGIRKLDMHVKGGRIIFDDKPNIDPMKVITLIQKRPWVFKLDGQDKLRFEIELPTVEEREEWVIKLMGEIGG